MPAGRLAEPALELLVVHLAVAVLVQHLCTNTWGASPSEYTKWKGGFASKFTWGGGASPSKYTRRRRAWRRCVPSSQAKEKVKVLDSTASRCSGFVIVATTRTCARWARGGHVHEVTCTRPHARGHMHKATHARGRSARRQVGRAVLAAAARGVRQGDGAGEGGGGARGHAATHTPAPPRTHTTRPLGLIETKQNKTVPAYYVVASGVAAGIACGVNRKTPARPPRSKSAVPTLISRP